MEYIIGYALGSGATWPTIGVIVVSLLAFGILMKALFNIE